MPNAAASADLARSSPRWAPCAASRAWRILSRREDMDREDVPLSAIMANPHKVDVAMNHIPVMLPQVMQALDMHPGQVAIDATFGAGGYTNALLDSEVDVVAIDRDPTAIEAGQTLMSGKTAALHLIQGRFSGLDHLARSAGFPSVDAVVADIGVSSMQIDQAERGFSFMKDGPLDMRMEMAGPGAADVVNGFERSVLTRIIGILGEEKKASKISAAIVAERDKAPFETTLQLAGCVENTLGRRGGDRIHPATRTFQALRIFVNRELDELANALLAAERILKPGGRLVVVTFHSLEDRLVKRFFQDRTGSTGGSRHLPEIEQLQPTFRLTRKGAIPATDEEAQTNVRARSAKLRFGLRTNEQPRDSGLDLFGLPRLPDQQDGVRS